MHSHHGHSHGEELRGCSNFVLLVGTPNSGKTTLFNALTGASGRVGNWPGVTTGLRAGRAGRYCIVDTPGLYHLDGSSMEEEILLRSMLNLKPEAVILVVDGANPEAGLALLVEVAEVYDGRVTVAIAKSDLARELGIEIDTRGLASRLGTRVISVSALRGYGVSELLQALEDSSRPHVRVDYGGLEAEIERLAVELKPPRPLDSRGVAVQLLAGDKVLARLLGVEAPGGYWDHVFDSRLRLVEELAEAYVRHGGRSRVLTGLDRVLLHPVLGPVAGFAVLTLAFLAVFSINIGFPLNILLDAVGLHGAAVWLEEHSLAEAIAGVFEDIVESVPGDGIASNLARSILLGVGIVASFIPLIALATGFMAALEDSGVLTRIAASFHPALSRFGLSGASVYPLLIAYGCNVPAVYSTRILPVSEKLRLLAAIPFMICSARLVVLVAFVYAFFPTPVEQALAAAGLYMTGTLMALVAAGLAGRITGARGGRPSLVMVLPPMKAPSMKVVYWSVKSSLLHFLKKMGGPITVAAVVIYGFLLIEVGGRLVGAMVGGFVGTIFKPLGIGDDVAWVLGLAALTGSLVKEVVLETIGIAYGVPSPSEAVSLLGLTETQALAVLFFYMTYVPCIGTMFSIASETSWKTTARIVAYTLTVATLGMYLVYGVTTLLW
ncbi:MAG: ferrous iron transporter B [Desulfurococcales archaeon]|nr:ferrous iron transporter B [Desulfurococcales archaeon]